MIARLYKPLHRYISIIGIDGIVVLTITPDGLSFRMKGSHHKVEAPWDTVISACTMPTGAHVARFLIGRPLEYLKVKAGEIAARARKGMALVKPKPKKKDIA